MKLVEGKDEPPERPKNDHEEDLGKTAALMMRLAKSLRYTNNNGFCVLKGVLTCKQADIRVQVMIKQKRYWPKYILGDTIAAHFVDKEVGDCDVQKLTLQGEDLWVHAMKDDGYVLSFLSSFWTLE